MGVSQPNKNDTRAPPAAESPSSHHSTPSKGKASTSRDSAQLLERANINGDTIKWLNEEGLGSIDHLKLLTFKSSKELCNGTSPKLPFGQILALESLVATWAPDANASLQNQPREGENATHQPPAEFRAPSTNLPAGNNLLQDNHTPPENNQPSMLQQSLNNIFGFQQATANRFTGTSQFQDPTSILNPRGKQPYLDIVEFIPGSIIEKERTEFPSGDGQNITIEAGPKRPNITSISQNQWGIANMRILTQLMANGSLPSVHHITNYLAYTAKIHQHAIRCTWASIMLYDREYRQLQATEGFPWGMDNIHLQTVYLREKVPDASHNQSHNAKPKNNQCYVKVDPKSGREVCISHNRQSGCSRTDCRFIHLCSICCSDAHNAINHVGSNSKNLNAH